MKKRAAQKQLSLLSKKKTDDLFHVNFVPEVYELLSLNYPGYKLINQRLVMKEGNKADVMEIEFQGETKEVTFVYD